MAACGSSDNAGSSSKSSPPASTSAPAATSASPDAQAQAKGEVLKAYDAFWGEQVKAYAQADIKGTDLKKYATKAALGGAMGDVLVMKKAGTATTGAPTHRAKVTSLTLSGDIPKATLQDCLDISNWKTVKKKSGKVQPFPSNQPLRYITTAKAEKWGKQWMITELTPEGDRTC
ncbi:hypothetical protein [Streptomyces sp. NPDC058272]|uniref:hypothetical protein n=1 Tax=Streptomyces sp. NPDC058272 TaxID=3346415 RepID=UPI0036E2B84E